ncbi:hypothetical protein Golomagni_03287 [Golovinomyces magnicellulatus]|nr:hypothetical protein Golomagni_03287 [Golovinomyces magnicellulatus]
MQKTQRGLDIEYQSDKMIKNNMVNACRDLKECSYACFRSSSTLESFCADIRASIGTATRIAAKQKSSYMSQDVQNPVFYTDRRYHGGHRHQQSNKPFSSYGNKNCVNGYVKRCFVCKKSGCWSSKHCEQERSKAGKDFRSRMRDRGTPFSNIKTRQYITEFEGEYDYEKDNYDNDDALEIEVMIADMILDSDNEEQQVLVKLMVIKH